MKVCWLCNYPSPYSMKHMHEIGKEIDLTVLMLGGTEEHRNDEWKIKDNHSFRVSIIEKDYYKQIKKIAKENDVFIDSMYSSIYGILATRIFNRLNKKTIMQADGGVAIDRGPIINKTISYFMNKHQYFLSSGFHCDEYFKYYNVDTNKIFHYRFSSLVEDDIKDNRKSIESKKEYRKELDIDDKFTLISVGRPIKGKGFDILVKAYLESGLTNDINLYIVGGKPQDEIAKFVEDNNLRNVHFVDLLGSKELNKYYAASDAFILCTRTDVWGLVLNEAMSFGLPVITSNNCGAGIHFNRYTNNVHICEVEDYKEYSEEIKNIYANKNKMNEIRNDILSVIKPYSIENGAVDIINVLKSI